MRNKRILPQVLVILSAIWAVCRLCGLPGQLHLTPFRVFFSFFTIAICFIWLILSNKTEKFSERPGLPALVFQLSLLTTAAAGFLLIASPSLMTREGVLYKTGVILKQAAPFLIYLIILSFCSAFLVIFDLSAQNKLSLRILFLDNTSVPETVILLLVTFMVFGAFIPLRDNYYPSHDYAIFAYFGQQILRGKMPYRDLWDHKPPLIFYFDALGLKLTGGSLVGIWLLEVILFFLGGLILLRLLKRYFPKWISITILSLGMLHYVRVFDFGNYTEELSLIFVICALALFFSGKRCSQIRLFGFLNGVLCGLAFTCKQNTVGCWAAFFLLELISSIPFDKNSSTNRRFIKYWLHTGIGFLLVNAGWVCYFSVNHALRAYWDVAFRFNFLYADKSSDSRLACAWTTLTFLPSVSPFLLFCFLSWFPAAYEMCRTGKTFIRGNVLTAWAVLALPLELILAGLSGMNYQHYFILCITPAIIPAAYVLKVLTEKVPSKRWYIKPTVCLTLCAASFPLVRCFSDNYMPRTPSSYTKTRDYLLSETDPDRSILVWGSRTAIYVMSERYAPTAYFNERPLYLFPGEIQESQWHELLNDLIKDPPQVIIYTHDTALPFIKTGHGHCTIPDDAQDYAVPVYQFFCDNYRYNTTINPEFYDAWDIYSIR